MRPPISPSPGQSTIKWITLGIGLGLLPLLLEQYPLILLSSALALSIGCLGVNLLMGYTGLLSLGHAGYFGIGAYAGALLVTFGNVRSLEIYLIAGVLAGTAVAAFFGLLCVRTTRIFFSILTLALAQIVHSLFISGAAFKPFGDTGKGFFLIGSGGLYIPRLTIGGRELAPEAFTVALYYVVLLAFLTCTFLMWRLVNSPFGLSLCAIRDNAARAEFIGIRVRAHRWRAFVFSAAFTAVAGGLSGQLDRQVTPQQLDWQLSAELVLACVLGGTRHFSGPIIGACALIALKEVALRVTDYHLLILGLMLVLVVFVLPGGSVDAARRLRRRLSVGSKT